MGQATDQLATWLDDGKSLLRIKEKKPVKNKIVVCNTLVTTGILISQTL